MTIQRVEPGPRMSLYVVHGAIVYTAGQVERGAPATISAKNDLRFSDFVKVESDGQSFALYRANKVSKKTSTRKQNSPLQRSEGLQATIA
jgi:hypothetical protein